MNAGTVNKVINDWFDQILKDFPPKIAEEFRENVGSLLDNLLSGRKNPDEIVEEIDDSFIEKIIKSGTKPVDLARRMDLLVKSISKLDKAIFAEASKIFVEFEPKLFQKFLAVYDKILTEEIAARERAERVLKVLNEVNQAAIRIENESELLREVCRILVDVGKYTHAWVGYAERDGTVRVVAKAGKDKPEIIRGKADSDIWKEDVERDVESVTPSVPRKAMKGEYFSSISLPLRLNGTVIGYLNIYASEENAFNEKEVELLQKLAENLTYVISNLRMKKERDRIENLFRTVIENTGTSIVVVEDGKIVFVNTEVEKQTGYSAKELIGKPFTILIAEEDRERILRYYRLKMVDPNSAPKSYELKFVDRYGNVKNGIVVATLIPHTKQIIASLIDVTELKKAERDRKESEEKYRLIFEFSPVGIILSGVDMKIIDCNDAALKIVGKRREEVIGRRWIDFGIFDKKDIPKVMEIFYRGTEYKSEPVELKIMVDGAARWINVFPVLLKNDNTPYLILIEDITEKKTREESIKDLVDRLEILRSIDLGIIRGKPIEGWLKDVLKRMKEKLGCDLLQIVVFADEGFEVSEPKRVIALTEEKIEELMMKRNNGQKREIIVKKISELEDLTAVEVELLKAGMNCYVMYPLITRDEEIGVLLAASRRKTVWEKLKFIKMVAGQLAIAVHEAILFEMKRRAYKQIEQNIEQFAILVDHIRNPLAAIHSYVEIYIDDKELKGKIVEQINRVVKLMEQLERGWLESEMIRDYLRRERGEG
ncbi:PAS domain S-box protein [Archaeoglobus neptunius]|uniref:PAS domain S-box protein n=1 Tax=Archaeoglobus neptunius TaxID=2798580 RepID=UPI0019283153|nr:PAS domain S-box protein [Archaeoglobus neptunius]